MSIDYAEAARLIRTGRRAERRGKAVQKLITGLITSTVSAFLLGWYLMLAVGIAHGEWVHGLPTLGYWWSCLLVALLRPLLTPSSNSEAKAS